MPKLTPPLLPPGPRQTLSEELHRLHRRAGWPSVRDLARALGTGVASSSRIHDAFTKPRLPAWGLVQVLVTELAQRIPRADPETETERFHTLWEAAAEASAETTDMSVVPVSRDLPPPSQVPSPPPLVLPPPAVPPAASTPGSADRGFSERLRFGVERDFRAKLKRVESYLLARRMGIEPEVSKEQIRTDMVWIFERTINRLTPAFNRTRAELVKLENSASNIHEKGRASGEFEIFRTLQKVVERMREACYGFEDVDNFVETFKDLEGSTAVILADLNKITWRLKDSS